MNKRILIFLFFIFAILLSFGVVSASDLSSENELNAEDSAYAVHSDINEDSSSENDVFPTNESNEESSAYLILDNDADNENIFVCELVTWIITAENKGPDTAKNTKVYDQLPDGLQYLYYSSTKGIFNPETGIWDIGDLNVEDGEVSLFITCKAISSGEKVNKAWITTDTKNLNNETFEEEEMDVFDYENEYHNNVIKESSVLKSAGNPLFLIFISLLLIFTNFKIRK